jgi:hypothetical protein
MQAVRVLSRRRLSRPLSHPPRLCADADVPAKIATVCGSAQCPGLKRLWRVIAAHVMRHTCRSSLRRWTWL